MPEGLCGGCQGHPIFGSAGCEADHHECRIPVHIIERCPIHSQFPSRAIVGLGYLWLSTSSDARIFLPKEIILPFFGSPGTAPDVV